MYRFASTDAGGSLVGAPLPAGTLTAGSYWVRRLAVTGYEPLAPVLVTITNADRLGTAVQNIDTFDTGRQAVTANTGTPVANSSVAAGGAIGGERDVQVTFTSGSGDVSVLIDQSDSNAFAFTSGLDVIGTALIQYDGPDNSTTLLGSSNLGGVSLSGGDANAGILLETRGDKSDGTVELRVYTSLTDFSTTIPINIPNQIPIEQIFVPFSSFQVGGGGGGATFTSVNAIELFVDGALEQQARVDVLGSLRPTTLTANLSNDPPAIEIIKTTNGQDANTAPGPFLAVGTIATFSYTVTATGGTALQTVVVTDDNGTAPRM